MSLEPFFASFRKNIIGRDQTFESPYGEKKIIYADWTASGRLYAPIENMLRKNIFPFVANTHTETSTTGATMSIAMHESLKIIKKHVNANKDDVIISAGAGMTMLVSKFQRILGLKIHEKFRNKIEIDDRPVIFVTHMEHHSNQTSWIETIADVVVIPYDKNKLVDLNELSNLLEKYQERKTKIAAITSCSNVTGVFTPYHEIAQLMHSNNGLCFVDFACSAPYIDINMHPENELQRLDAIYFSPHKFLGGPGSSGVLVFNKNLYKNNVPDNPGGGTVDWTNPWGQHKYVEDIESREDGGTPAFLQTIKTALCIQLKEKMQVNNILKREKELHGIIWKKFKAIPNLVVLADNIEDRLGVYSFYIEGAHYNLIVQLLNDIYGIQVRGGCSCAGTYGHILLNVDQLTSNEITCSIDEGNLSTKPGWIRMSIHPTMTNDEIHFIMNAIEDIAINYKEFQKEYVYNEKSNEFTHEKEKKDVNKKRVDFWFSKQEI